MNLTIDNIHSISSIEGIHILTVQLVNKLLSLTSVDIFYYNLAIEDIDILNMYKQCLLNILQVIPF